PPQVAPPQPAPPYAAAQGPVPFDQTAPFAPVVREPRVPWINPDRRSHLLGAALIGALLVLGAGFGIGYAVAPSDHDRNGPQRFERGGPNFQGPPGQLAPGRQRGQFPGGGNGYGQRNGPGGVQPAPSSSGATPAPSTTG
ncbi:MAG: hypothetical protein QOC66_1681, partial [Pseudonocardiales bacterium]|nr:hypothetical protein [Pseudonocardiales bacterium]